MKTTIYLFSALLLAGPLATSAAAGCCKEAEQPAEMMCMGKKSDAGSTAGGGCCKGKASAADSKDSKVADAGSHDGGSGKSDVKSNQGPISDSSAAFETVNMNMHREMSISFSGDADVDFIKSMIPHHQGAIDMANVALKYGKDPVTRKLAEDIIKAQENEITMMKGWLAKRQK